MGKRKYYCQWLHVTFCHSFGTADTISVFASAILYGAGKLFKVEVMTSMNWWWLPLVVLGAILAVRLLLAPYWIYRDKAEEATRILREKETVQQQLQSIEDSKPHIAFHSKGEWLFYPQDGPQKGQPTYRALELWFINKPQISSEKAVAQKVTCSVVFYDRNTKPRNIFGCFTRPEAYGFATVKDLTNEIDEWHPNNEPRKLMIALKWPGDDSAYAFAMESLLSHGDGKAPDKQINRGDHYVKVEFQGTRLDQSPFWFMLANPGKEGYLSISDPIEKPDLSKEGFQNE